MKNEKIQEHYLGNKTCPLKGNGFFYCTGKCAWFDHEEEDCRMIGSLGKIIDSLNYIRETVEYIDKGVNLK